MRCCFAWLALAAWIGGGTGIDAVSQTPMHAGPVFTREDVSGVYPRYPDLDLQVEVPPGTSPQALVPANFRLAVDNGSSIAATSIQSLSSAGYGIAVSFSLDVSGSMEGAPLKAVRSGLIQFVNNSGPLDKIAVQTIANDGRWDANWNDSRDQIRSTVNGLAARGSLTRLWDSLLDAVAHFPSTPLSQRLIVISDGHDEGSSHSLQEVIAAATARSIIVDAIGVTRSNPAYLRNLEKLAEQTGGEFQEAKQPGELQNLVGSGIEAVKATPVVRFRLSNPPADAGLHRLQVTWNHSGAESRADKTTILPAAPPSAPNWWLWGGCGAVLLTLVLLAIVKARKREPPLIAPALLPVTPPSPTGTSVPRMPVRTPTQVPFGDSPTPVASLSRPIEPQRVAPRQPAAPSTQRKRTEVLGRFPTPGNGRPAAWLLCEDGFAPGKRFPVDKKEYWIGALENNHLLISGDPTVSGNHACLVFEHEVLGIYDYRSTNGTMVNGELVGEARRLLRPGDRIRIGHSTFCVQDSSQEGPGR